ncbi:hypothetical protein K469DRAFT_685078 [Zopfia rhizophila CBS 207.26]|uniref:FAD linked oxidase N-terminal domain-containing protein n=1 Tax=Zopfia rhizophila CBS 207.26 TaxID=1314779 RepID=A0A6A6EER2_9PEZI|nr:hypothetical protein K469DRAFT_685078 [Zopfia rhizophila CBS 207.26]
MAVDGCYVRTKMRSDKLCETRGNQRGGRTKATARWQWWRAAEISAVVDVRVEENIQQTIPWANKEKTSSIAQSGDLDGIFALGNVKKGIQIWMRSMNQVTISEDGTYATIEGGEKAREATDAL